jgi:hypothetical protein
MNTNTAGTRTAIGTSTTTTKAWIRPGGPKVRVSALPCKERRDKDGAPSGVPVAVEVKDKGQESVLYGLSLASGAE